MKKYVFAGDWTLEKTVGINRFAHQVLKAMDPMLSEVADRMDVELLIPGNSNFSPNFQNIKVVKKGSTNHKGAKHIWQQIVFPWYVRSHKAVGIDLTLALPVWGCDLCAIYDCIYEAFPEGFQDHKLYRWLYIGKVKRCAASKKRRIITDSQEAKGEIQKYYGISDERMDVIGCGWEHMTQLLADESIFQKLPQIEKQRYFFSLGSRYRHKNFEWVLKTARKNPQHQFVVSGADTYSNAGDTLNSQKPENVTFTGYLEDGELKALMVNCMAFIQPSLYEGFGIPPLEALSLGKRIIVSNISSLPEVYQDAAYYIDPYSDDCDLDALLSGTVAPADTVLNQYTWHNSAKKLLELLENWDSNAGRGTK